MSLTHEFFLISSDFELNDRIEWYSANRYTWNEKSEVSDDFIQYLVDFLNWIPSFNPETKQNGKGLNYHGITIIYKPGAQKLIKIIEKWLKLMDEAPDTFRLRGDIVWHEEENEEGYWMQTGNWIRREEMKHELEQLIGLAVKASKNNQFIIHYGI